MSEKAQTLLDSDSDSDESDQKQKILINKKFAKGYEIQKQQQELRKARLDGEASGDDDSDAESEDDDGELLTTKLDTTIMKTLNALRNKDKSIYNPETRFFEKPSGDGSDSEDSKNESKAEGKREKRKTYKDVVREQILEDMEKGSNGNEEEGENKKPGYKTELAYDDEQREIRKAFLNTSNGSDEEDDVLLVVKNASKRQADNNEEFLEEVEKLEKSLENRGEAAPTVVDPKGEVKDGEKFLLDFFKKRSWVDPDQGVSSDSDDDNGEDEKMPMKASGTSGDGNESDNSLERLDQMDDFESQYNFRFEAAEAAGGGSGADFSNVGYARGQLMETMRRRDDSRIQKRIARKERKDAERRAKEEQLKRLKNAKRQEMDRNLAEIKKVLGEVDAGDADVDEAAILKMMEGDYDPEKLEKIMEEAFGEEYYQREDSQWKSEKDVRAELAKDEDGALLVGDGDDGDDADDDDDNEKDEAEGNEEDEWVEEEEFNDEEYDTTGQDQEETDLEKKLKSKMEDELYKLDYEDIIDGMPTRFKYRKVEPNNYGLSTEEVLFARDDTLRQYVSLKKMAPYREDEEFAVGRSKRRAFRDTMKRDLEEVEKEVPAEEKEEEEPVIADKKKKRRKKKNKDSQMEETEDDGDLVGSNMTANSTPELKSGEEEAEKPLDTEDGTPHSKQKRRRRKKKSSKGVDSEETNPLEGGETGTSVNERETTSPTPQPEDTVAASDEVDTPSKDLHEETTVKSEKRKKIKSEAKRDKKEKKKAKKQKVEGITASRLESYGM